jgi:hypothetical protein
MQRKVGLGPPRSTPDEVRTFVRRYRRTSLLRAIGRAALAEGTDSRMGRHFPGPNAIAVALTQFGLADLARFALHFGNEHRDIDADDNAVLQGMNLINGLDEPDIGPDADATTMGIYLMRLGAKQFPLQTAIKPRMARTLLLFDRLPPSVVEASAYDIPKRFHDLTGVTITQFVWVCFAISTLLQTSPDIDLSAGISHGLSLLDPLVNEETVLRTLPLISCTAEEFRASADIEAAGLVDPRQEHWAFNPLYTRPLVHLGGRRYIAPVPRLLIERMIDAPYFELLTADGIEFTKRFGYVFQAYVGELLRPFAGDRLRPELRYATDARTADWSVFDLDGITQVEVKTGRLRKEAKTTGSAQVVLASLKTHYGQAARQLYRVSQRIDQVPELASFRRKPLHSLIVLLDPINTINSPLFADLRAEAKAAEKVPVDFEPQIASVGAIEMLAPSLGTRSLADIYQAKVSTADHAFWDWDTYVRGQLPLVEHPLLSECFEEFIQPAERSRPHRPA